MRRLRISAISYLNTAPLMWDFEHGQAGREFEISYTVPSQCAAELKHGTADIGIVPAAAFATIPGLIVLPDVAIASRGAVRSILLVSKVPLHKIRTVALDNSSLTSAALLEVLFAKGWGAGRTFSSLPKLDEMLRRHDAGLLIGDPALQVDRSRYFTYDLAEEWVQLTGKSFVFAFWAMREQALAEIPSATELAAVFKHSRDHGLELQNLAQIALHWAGRLGLSEADVVSYLQHNIHYYLDPDCLEGLQLFYRYASEYGLLPSAPPLRFLDVPRLTVR